MLDLLSFIPNPCIFQVAGGIPTNYDYLSGDYLRHGFWVRKFFDRKF